MTWRQASDDELLYALNCGALANESRKQVRREFAAASVDALKAMASSLRRVPTQGECDLLHRALVRWFNDERIPLMKPEIVH